MGDDEEIMNDETELVDISSVSDVVDEKSPVRVDDAKPLSIAGRGMIANLRQRFAAFLIDTAILFYFYWILGTIARRAMYGSWDGPVPCYGWQGMAFHGGFLVFAFIYYLIFEGVFFATPGKFMCWMNVRKKDGSFASMSAVFARNLFRIVDYALPVLPFFTMELTKARQRVGDLIGGTTVVKRYSYTKELYGTSMINIASATGRLLSSIFDLAIVGTLTLGYLLFLSSESPTFSKWLLLFSPLVPAAYFVVSETLARTSPGKWLFGYIVTHGDGTPVSFSGSLTRTFMRIFDTNPVGLIVMWLSRNRQRPGDLAADTIVSKQPREWRGGVAFLLLLLISVMIGWLGMENRSNFINSTSFRFNFLPTLEIFGGVTDQGGYQTPTLTHFRFAAENETTIRTPPVFEPGETLFIIFDLYGYQKSGRMVWMQEDLEVRYPDQSIGLHQENIIDFHQVISTDGPIELSNKFFIPLTAKPGTYTLQISVRDLFAHERVSTTKTFEVHINDNTRTDIEEAPESEQPESENPDLSSLDQRALPKLPAIKEKEMKISALPALR